MKKIYLIRVYTEACMHSFVLVANSILEVYAEFYQKFKTNGTDFEITCISDSNYTLEETLYLLS